MKCFSEFCGKITNHTKLFVGAALLVLAAIFSVSGCFAFLSERYEPYFSLAEYADALLLCLRPCCVILGGGAIALQWLETREPKA